MVMITRKPIKLAGYGKQGDGVVILDASAYRICELRLGSVAILISLIQLCSANSLLPKTAITVCLLGKSLGGP